MNDDIQLLLVDSACGIYGWHSLVTRYSLYIKSDNDYLALSDYLKTDKARKYFDGLETIETIFNPDSEFYCDSIEYLDGNGLFVKNDSGEYWRVEQSEHSDIWAINPRAVWCDETDQYIFEVQTND